MSVLRGSFPTPGFSERTLKALLWFSLPVQGVKSCARRFSRQANILCRSPAMRTAPLMPWLRMRFQTQPPCFGASTAYALGIGGRRTEAELGLTLLQVVTDEKGQQDVVAW